MEKKYANKQPVVFMDFLRSKKFSPQLSFERNAPTNYVSDGLIKVAPANVPTYGRIGNEKRGLFLEPASTNLFPNSNVLNASAGTEVGSFTTIAPDGVSIAQSIVEAISTTEHYSLDYVSTVYAGNTYVESIYVKPLPTNTGEHGIILRFAKPVTDQTIQSQVAFMFKSDGTVTITTVTDETAGAEYVGNGWWRLWHKKLMPSTQEVFTIRVQLTNSLIIGDGTGAGGVTVYPGRANHGFYMWGRQIEISSRATSLITTGASQATRPVTLATVQNIANKVNQTHGALAFEYMITNNPRSNIAIGSLVESVGNLARTISIRHTVDNKVQAIGWGQILTPALAANTLGKSNKVAVSYGPQEVVVCVNGNIARIAHSMTGAAFVKLLIGHFSSGSNAVISDIEPITIEKLSYYDSKLTDVELAALCK